MAKYNLRQPFSKKHEMPQGEVDSMALCVLDRTLPTELLRQFSWLSSYHVPTKLNDKRGSLKTVLRRKS